MQEQPDGGSIIMIGSVSGTRPSPGTAAYGAAKAGLHHLVTSLAIEWAPKVRGEHRRPRLRGDGYIRSAPGRGGLIIKPLRVRMARGQEGRGLAAAVQGQAEPLT